MSNAKIAEVSKLSERQVRRIIRKWNESPLRLDTEGAAEAVAEALKASRDDMEALGVTAAMAPPRARIKILTERIGLVEGTFKAMKAAGVSFEGILDSKIKDPDLIVEVNIAIRGRLEQNGVDPAAIDEALEAGLGVYADWGFTVGSTPAK